MSDSQTVLQGLLPTYLSWPKLQPFMYYQSLKPTKGGQRWTKGAGEKI